jgi:hypothetical protein
VLCAELEPTTRVSETRDEVRPENLIDHEDGDKPRSWHFFLMRQLAMLPRVVATSLFNAAYDKSQSK